MKSSRGTFDIVATKNVCVHVKKKSKGNRVGVFKLSYERIAVEKCLPFSFSFDTNQMI